MCFVWLFFLVWILPFFSRSFAGCICTCLEALRSSNQLLEIDFFFMSATLAASSPRHFVTRGTPSHVSNVGFGGGTERCSICVAGAAHGAAD